jgi:hypothetical protein
MVPTPILKFDDDNHLVFGWANVSIRQGGEVVVDSHDDLIEPDTLEAAAYLFNLDFRSTGVMHKGTSVGRMVESFFVTSDKLTKMGLSPDALPTGWWVGFHVESDEVWKSVKDGTYSMFSIQGTAIRSEV